MVKDKFVKHCNKFGIRIIKRLDYKYESLVISHKRLKLLSKYLKYPCVFNDDGSCNGSFNDTNVAPCCCKHCYHNIGYVSFIFEKDITKYSRKFEQKVGFWREGVGCVLPRELRSIICLTFLCNKVKILNYTFSKILNAYDFILTNQQQKIKRYANGK